MEALGLNAVRSVAREAQRGKYMSARMKNFAYRSLMKKAVGASEHKSDAQDVLNSYLSHFNRFESYIHSILLNDIKAGKLVWIVVGENLFVNSFSGMIVKNSMLITLKTEQEEASSPRCLHGLGGETSRLHRRPRVSRRWTRPSCKRSWPPGR